MQRMGEAARATLGRECRGRGMEALTGSGCRRDQPLLPLAGRRREGWFGRRGFRGGREHDVCGADGCDRRAEDVAGSDDLEHRTINGRLRLSAERREAGYSYSLNSSKALCIY
jgi:hypothetical protein